MINEKSVQGESQVNDIQKPMTKLGVQTMVLVWDSPRGTHRSEYLGQHLGADVRHIYITREKGWYIAPVKYCCQTMMTLALLSWVRPQLIFVQNPPVFAALSVYLYRQLFKAFFIIDSHTDALLAPFWKWTLPLHRFLSTRAITTMVTNNHLQQIIASWGAPAFVLSDVPCIFSQRQRTHLPDSALSVAVVSSASYDEPIQQVLAAARALPDVSFFITGNYRTKSRQETVKMAPGNVHFVGYLPDEEFYGLLEEVQVVMSLTTEDYTYQSGASEALWLGKPIITSNWPLLQQYFNQGTIHVDNTTEGIRQALLTMKCNLQDYQAEILMLQRERMQEWREKAQALTHLVEQAMI